MSVRYALLFITLFLIGASSASSQSWKITTPRQVLPVPSDGSVVNFPNVSLASGIKYRVHASQRVSVSSGSDIADASYYFNILPFAPTIVPVSLKTRTSPTFEDWFYNFWSASGFQNSYQSNHNYDASITSQGSPLSFRFFDTDEPANKPAKYADNSGSILIDVARETPGVAIERDTLDFGKIHVGTPKMLLDSIESYGIDSYNVARVSLVGASAAKFSVNSERTVPFALTDTTNEFQITYLPSGVARDSAEFHIFSSNGFGQDTERVIYLFGEGISASIAFRPDTLDFGVLKSGATLTLPDTILNLNNVGVVITSVVPQTPGSPYSVTGTPLTIAPNGSGTVNVTFVPTALGTYFETFNVTTNDGSVFHFYAIGVAGAPKVSLEKSVLDFGQVILKQSRTLTDQFGNIGTAPLNIISTQNTNPLEYTVVGNQGAITYEPGHSIIYSFIFSPQVHIPFCQNHDGKFVLNYDDGTSTTITFLGCDHQPLDVLLKIDTSYFVSAGKTIDIKQSLVNPGDPLDSTLTPTVTLSERISYDATLFDLVSVTKGLLISDPAWVMTSTPSTGYVDINIKSATLHFGPGGPLLLMRFRAHDDAITGRFTPLFQSNIDFGNPVEPFALTDPGRITISDICFPVNLQSGDFASSIEQNNPNPFNPTTHMHYAVGRNSDGSAVNVRITLYDQLGRFIGELVNEPKTPGSYEYEFDGSPYPTGAYTYVFEAGDHVERKTMLLAK